MILWDGCDHPLLRFHEVISNKWSYPELGVSSRRSRQRILRQDWREFAIVQREEAKVGRGKLRL